jgi:hypothetical protein
LRAGQLFFFSSNGKEESVLTGVFYLKVGYEGSLEQHTDCAEHIRAVSAKTGVRKEVAVIPDGVNTCLRITVWPDSVGMFHMLIGGLVDWASVQYGRAVLEIIN